LPATQPDIGISATANKPKLIVIGDRIMTDILLANEMGAYGIWTTRLWQREALILRFLERSYLFLVTTWLAFISERRKRRLRLTNAEEEEKEPGRKPGTVSVEARGD
jgi:Mitochondrial PGP phosphatase